MKPNPSIVVFSGLISDEAPPRDDMKMANELIRSPTL